MAKLSVDKALLKAKSYAKKGEPAEAQKLYQAVLQAFPKNKRAQQGLAVLNKPQQTNATQSPPQEAINQLINLYNQGQLPAAVEQAQALTEQYPDAFIVWNLRGAANNELGRVDEAIEAYKKAISIKPNNFMSYYNMGNALKDQGKLDEAINAYNKAISIESNDAEAYNNRATALQERGKLDEAIESYKKAISIKPVNYASYYNMATALKERGKLDEAIEAFKKAISIKSDNANAYNNMGLALKEQGKLNEAIEAYKKAISINSDNAIAYNNMGVALKEQGKQDEAIGAYSKAIYIKPDNVEAYNNLGLALDNLEFTQSSIGLQKIIHSLLDRKTHARPSSIAKAAISLLKLHPVMKEFLENHTSDKPLDELEESVLTLCEFPLLLKLMSVCPLADLKLENVLTDFRSRLLSYVLETPKSLKLFWFQSALALQCFTNEYIYSSSDEDSIALQRLETSVEKTLSNGEQPSPQAVLCLASYKALHEYEWCNLLAMTTNIEEVFKRQVIEPKQESQLKREIPSLKEISNEVSLKVRAQYEANPYPRWVNLRLPFSPAPIPKIAEELSLQLFDYKIKEVDDPNILIAGCGTGQHSIGTAARFKNSNVTAIDLSLSSLAYAKRKTEEMGIQNIEYVQADILDLGKLGKQFDIIESAGVLHHMDDPLAGWKVLTDCLKPNGLMKIGLYSELARRDVVKQREGLRQSAMGLSDPLMKLLRNEIIRSDKHHHKQITKSPDFYSLSTLRDLLFHVQEHRFTISQIQGCLLRLGLKFCGFEAENIVQNFRLLNVGGNDPYDLDKWKLFEENNPSAFGEMYQFWCQKVH